MCWSVRAEVQIELIRLTPRAESVKVQLILESTSPIKLVGFKLPHQPAHTPYDVGPQQMLHMESGAGLACMLDALVCETGWRYHPAHVIWSTSLYGL